MRIISIGGVQLAIRFCSHDVNSIELKSISTTFLWSYFLPNNTDSILVVNNDDEFFGICTYKLLLSAGGNLDNCIETSKIYASINIFDECKKILKNSKCTYIPIINNNNELIYFAYEDIALNEFLAILDIIKSQNPWYFEEILTDSIFFVDLNEVSYELYLYALNRNMAVYVDGEKWSEILNINNKGKLENSIILDCEKKGEYQDNFYRHCNVLSDYLFLKNVLSINILMDMNKQLYSLDENDNYHDALIRKKKINGEIDLTGCMYSNYIKIFTGKEFACILRILKRILKKSLVAILANCQGEIMYDMLTNSTDFMNEYYILRLPPLWDMKGQKIEKISDDVLKELNLYIYQYIKTESDFSNFASENIDILLHNECKKMCIPNLYFEGYFPQCAGRRKPRSLILNHGDTPIFDFIDSCIEKEFAECKSIKKVTDKLENVDYFTSELVYSNLKKSLDELKEREKKCDIKMSDYIHTNYKKKWLFTEPSHPINEVIAELVYRLLDKLDIKGHKIEHEKYRQLGDRYCLLYPSTTKILDLEFNVDDGYYCMRSLYNIKLTFEQYIELYIRNVCELE